MIVHVHWRSGEDSMAYAVLDLPMYLNGAIWSWPLDSAGRVKLESCECICRRNLHSVFAGLIRWDCWRCKNRLFRLRDSHCFCNDSVTSNRFCKGGANQCSNCAAAGAVERWTVPECELTNARV